MLRQELQQHFHLQFFIFGLGLSKDGKTTGKQGTWFSRGKKIRKRMRANITTSTVVSIKTECQANAVVIKFLYVPISSEILHLCKTNKRAIHLQHVSSTT